MENVRHAVGLWSPSFAPPDRDGAAQTNVPGFPFYEPDDAERKAIAPDLQAFLDGGEPPIVFTPSCWPGRSTSPDQPTQAGVRMQARLGNIDIG